MIVLMQSPKATLPQSIGYHGSRLEQRYSLHLVLVGWSLQKFNGVLLS